MAFVLRSTPEFDVWRVGLKDKLTISVIARRLARARTGNLGVTRALGSGIAEMKIDFGPGYRIYYTRRGTEILLLLCGGDKSTQNKDIDLAKRLAKQFQLES